MGTFISEIYQKSGYRIMRHNKTSKFIKLTIVSLLLLLAFIGYHTVQKTFGSHTELLFVEPLTEKDNTLIRNTTLSSDSSLSDYTSVWERNLFNTSQKALSPPQKQIDFVNVVETDKNIDLNLLGTVVGDVSATRFAIIEYKSGQNIYHEGDTAGSYIIKKILRNNVIITNENGDKLLALKSDLSEWGEVVLTSSSKPPTGATRHRASGGRFKTVKLPREDIIMASFDDIDRLTQKVGTSSYTFGKLIGFEIDSISDKSIFKKIGLRSHDNILALNNKTIKGQNGVLEFFEQISEGKKVTIKYRRRNRTHLIELNPI